MHRSSSSTDSVFPRPGVRQILMENQEMRQRINELEHLIKNQEREYKSTVSGRAGLEHEFVNRSNDWRAKQADIEAKEMQHLEEIRKYKEAVRALKEKLKVAEESQLEQLRWSENEKTKRERDGLQEQIKNLEVQLKNTKEDYERKLLDSRFSRDAYVQKLKDDHERGKQLVKEAMRTKVTPCCKPQGQTKVVGNAHEKAMRAKVTPCCKPQGQTKVVGNAHEKAMRAKVTPCCKPQGQTKFVGNKLKPRTRRTLSTQNHPSIDLMPVTRGDGQQKDTYRRFHELHERNLLVPPHLRESYFIEAQSDTAYGIVKGQIPKSMSAKY